MEAEEPMAFQSFWTEGDERTLVEETLPLVDETLALVGEMLTMGGNFDQPQQTQPQTFSMAT